MSVACGPTSSVDTEPLDAGWDPSWTGGGAGGTQGASPPSTGGSSATGGRGGAGSIVAPGTGGTGSGTGGTGGTGAGTAGSGGAAGGSGGAGGSGSAGTGGTGGSGNGSIVRPPDAPVVTVDARPPAPPPTTPPPGPAPADAGAPPVDAPTVAPPMGGMSDPPCPSPCVGLRGEYFDNDDFTNSKGVRFDPQIDFIWESAGPHPGVGGDTFSVRWTGFVKPRYTESYTFIIQANDNVRLWVDGTQLLDVFDNTGRRVTDATAINLMANKLYEIRIEYREKTGDAEIRMWWKSASQNQEIVPSAALARSSAALASGLQAHFRLEPGDGSNVQDASNNKLLGSLHGFQAADFVEGRAGQSLNFAPGRATYVEVADAASLNPTAAMSVAAWVKIGDLVGNRRILQKGMLDDQYRLLVEQGQLKFHLQTTTGGVATSLLPPEARWVHVAGSYDGATVRLWVDGNEAGSGPASGPIKVTADPLRIGAKTPVAPSGDFWAGQLDEVLIYDRALSADEIRALASGALP